MERLPPEIRVEEGPDGVLRYTLPRRPTSIFGLIPLIIGVGLIGAGGVSARLVPPGEVLFFAVFVVAFPLFGSVAVLAGLMGLLGWVEIVIQDGRLRFSDRLFGLGWWRSREAAKVRVDVVRTPVQNEDGPVTSGAWADFSELVAYGPGPREARMATSYDIKLLRPLAADLNRRLERYRSPMQ